MEDFGEEGFIWMGGNGPTKDKDFFSLHCWQEPTNSHPIQTVSLNRVNPFFMNTLFHKSALLIKCCFSSSRSSVEPSTPFEDNLFILGPLPLIFNRPTAAHSKAP